jgi:formylglycine-generating enzyme required for sulfatase activity
MVAVLPGTVQVLEPKSRLSQELTIHRRFAISALPVTQHFYASIMGSNPSHFVGDDRRPVERVAWYDAVEFCNALSTQEGLEPVYIQASQHADPDFNPRATGYRLPSEDEWAFCCVGGTTGRPYPSDVSLAAWYQRNAGGSTQPVGHLAANGLGILDMLGNVEEWCQDLYGNLFLASAPKGPSRVCRGGSWNDAARDVSPESRSALFPDHSNRFTGFRIARTIP